MSEQWNAQLKKAVFTGLCFMSTGTVLAQELSPSLEEPLWWDSSHEAVSETVGSWSRNLDSFFSGQRHDTINDSFVSIYFSGALKENGDTSGFFDLDARLELPNTEDRLKLIIESDADQLTQDNRTAENDTGQNIAQSENTHLATMLRYAKNEWDGNIDVGVLLRMPFDPFARTTFKQNWQLDEWKLRQKESLFIYYTLGNGARYSISAVRPFHEQYVFGAEFRVTYLEFDSDTYWRENLYVTQRLSDKSSLRYQVSYLQSGSRPNADSFLYYLKYQKVLYKNWLIGEIRPQVTYKDSNDYNSELSLSMSLEVLLGPNYL